MRRLLIGLIAGAIAFGIFGESVVAFWIVFLATWAAMHVISPGSCPHCGKGVKFLYETCHHCGQQVKQGDAA